MRKPRVRHMMDAGARRWLMSYAQRHYWRVAAWRDYDDLLGDGFCLYYKVRARYPDVYERKHIMSLFMRTYSNHITDLANARSRLLEDAWDPQQMLSSIAEPECTTSELLMLLAGAPARIRAVLLAALKVGSPLSAQFRRRPDGTRESWNERFCKIAGVSPQDFNLYQDVRDYLRHDG